MNTVESDIVMACQIASDADIVSARQQGRTVAADMGFSRPDQALIATSISELARNIVNYAKTGTIELSLVNRGSKRGLRVVAKDSGPGIENLEAAMTDGFSTARSLGLGLPGTRRMVDDFHIASEPGKGVKVTVVKWLH
ncbi:anti-sigma regulatory factor [Pararhodobacter zhoushanensis]|uniref:Anti-sigma regulatory factor n=1 Tax=Pararhodobacter zhoushanensis TaxID=2479545 RepID=A0ABT3H2K3_9RHOB|nr:anti-sigma regulatory factor [Pararhodobacter zhoushanensis]MCW1933915.1 anti-sigma regulatory factor [Pararhodobacter zhoushanensis]